MHTDSLTSAVHHLSDGLRGGLTAHIVLTNIVSVGLGGLAAHTDLVYNALCTFCTTESKLALGCGHELPRNDMILVLVLSCQNLPTLSHSLVQRLLHFQSRAFI